MATKVKIHYDNLAERTRIITQQEKQGLRMLHDTYDFDWKKGDEPHGELIFTDEPSPKAIPERDLAAEIDELRVEIASLKAR